jgi:hypothetical protein
MCVMEMGGYMADLKVAEEPALGACRALRLMREAITELDEIGAPADIGAHLDRAISRLEQSLSDQSAS